VLATLSLDFSLDTNSAVLLNNITNSIQDFLDKTGEVINQASVKLVALHQEHVHTNLVRHLLASLLNKFFILLDFFLASILAELRIFQESFKIFAFFKVWNELIIDFSSS